MVNPVSYYHPETRTLVCLQCRVSGIWAMITHSSVMQSGLPWAISALLFMFPAVWCCVLAWPFVQLNGELIEILIWQMVFFYSTFLLWIFKVCGFFFLLPLLHSLFYLFGCFFLWILFSLLFLGGLIFLFCLTCHFFSWISSLNWFTSQMVDAYTGMTWGMNLHRHKQLWQ